MRITLIKISDHKQYFRLLVVRDLHQNQSCHCKSQIFRGLRCGQLFAVWDWSHCKWQSRILNCVFGFGGDPSFVPQTKVKIGWVVLWLPPNHGNVELYLARIIYPSCENPHTR